MANLRKLCRKLDRLLTELGAGVVAGPYAWPAAYRQRVPQRVTILTTTRLVLTTWTRADAPELHQVHSDPETMRYVRSGRPETLDETESLIDSYMREQSERGWTKWRLADLQGRIVGRAGFGPHGDGRELGYTIRRDMWGKGMATEIASALVDRHRVDAVKNEASHLQAYVAVANAPSSRVLEKVGLACVGTLDHDGTPCYLYRLPE